MTNQSSGEYPDFEPPSGSPGWGGLSEGEAPAPRAAETANPAPVTDVWAARNKAPTAQQPVAAPANQPWGASQPGVNQPGVNQPGANQPGANQPGVNQPEVNQPWASQPWANRPGVNQPAGDPWAPPSAAHAATLRQHTPGPQRQDGPKTSAIIRPASSPSRGTPITWSIIAICLAVWAAELTIPQFFERVMLTPRTGALEPWRFITSAFAHSFSFAHIAFNMYALWIVGRILEPFLGRMRFLALYLVSALAGGVGVVLLAGKSTMAWDTGVVGASGAVFGLFGALLVISRVTGSNTTSLVMLLVINAAIGFLFPNIAWQAHLGGFLAGIAVSWIMIRNVQSVAGGGRDRTWWQMVGLTGLMVLALLGKYALF